MRACNTGPIRQYQLCRLQSPCDAPADAAGGEEEPVHEDAGAVVIWVVGQQAVPLVLLLAGTVAVTS